MPKFVVARIIVENLSTGIGLHFGFAEKPDVPTALRAHAEEIGCDPTAASFFVGREVPVASLQPEVPLWQERIYAFHGAQRRKRAGLLPDRTAASC